MLKKKKKKFFFQCVSVNLASPYLYQFLFFFSLLSLSPTVLDRSQMFPFVLTTCPCSLSYLGPIPPTSMISLSNPAGWFRYWAFHISYRACSSSVNISAITNWCGNLIARNASDLSHSCRAHLNSCSQAIQLSLTRKSSSESRQKLSSTSSPDFRSAQPQ